MNIFQLKITLRYIESPVWRRVEVAADTPLEALHEIIQISMGWEDVHLHAFRAGKHVYGIPEDDVPGNVREEFGVPLASIAGPGDTVVYEYDFGDGWEHAVTVEKSAPMDPDGAYPRCIGGEGACPPEDCGGPPGYARLLEALHDPDDEEHEEIHEWLGQDFDPGYFDADEVNAMLQFNPHDLLDLPEYDPAELASLSPAELIELLIAEEDRVPRNLIDECARRGEPMVEALEPYLGPGRGAEPGYWWLPLHAAMILGLIPGQRSAELLLNHLRSIAESTDYDLKDWLAGYWPALMRNKPDEVIEQVRSLCRDKRLPWILRTNLHECVLAAAQRRGQKELDHAVDEAAEIAADEDEVWEMRVLAVFRLLDFPRERHRALLERLEARQPDTGRDFGKDEIEFCFSRGRDDPEWDRFTDPWAFYDPQAIAARQRRWLEEALIDDDPFLDGEEEFDNVYALQQPARRETPKVGRNDPCPCGSGKKYKKCCLGKTLH